MTNEEKLQTSFPRILIDDCESSLLENILNESVFGFVQCDVESPASLVKENFLFPPIISHINLTEDMISPDILGKFHPGTYLTIIQVDVKRGPSNFRSKLWARRTVGRIYFYWLLWWNIMWRSWVSKLWKFINLFNIIPDAASSHSLRKVDNFFFQIIKWIVTHLRNQARQEGNKTKGLTAKLIGKNLFFQV